MLYPRKVWFIFADWKGFSGQREASRLIYENLPCSRWCVQLLRMPALDRGGGKVRALLCYVMHLVWSWLKGLRIAGQRTPLLHLNIGQTSAALTRDGFVLRLVCFIRPQSGLVVSLHGSNFMDWRDGDALTKRFVGLLHHARIVTVLGESQRLRLVQFGVPSDRVRVVPNTCAVEPLAETAVRTKHQRGETLHVLFLSSLIDSKGYPEFLEALLKLSRGNDVTIDAVLCGPLTPSQFSERFATGAQAREWINATVAEINRGGRVRVRWVPGAVDEAKWALFQEAQVFVLPTRYRVEAQPIVLLEAMAHGCAIVCTTVGEIRSILSEKEACLLERSGAVDIAAAIIQLAKDSALRQRFALEGWRRFNREFSLERYVARWEALLNEVSSKS